MTDVQLLPLKLLQNNSGQIEGVPKNPRQIKDEQYKRLVKSLKESDLTDFKPLLVYPLDGKYVVLGGNMRLRALRELKADAVACIVMPEDTPVETLRKAVIIDNTEYGEYDWDAVANEWSDMPLEDWGVDLPLWDEENKDNEDRETGEEIERNPKAEKLLNAAMKQYLGEFVEQLQKSKDAGFFITGYSRGFAKLQFLNAKYYGRKYDKKSSYVFAPEIFFTSSQKSKKSYWEQMIDSATNASDAGIAGFRTSTNDGLLLRLLGGGYPIGRGRSCSDFPVDKARELYAKFANGGRVLDPCHGWGGRCTGALLECVREYVGVDPSQVANRAVNDIYNTFGEYQDTKVRTICKPYEETTDDEVGVGFDFALTSPPYFDVEDYAGENQSHKRYNNYQLWMENFYTPLIENTMRRLKDGGCFALQVGSQTYPLKDDAIRIGHNLGYDARVYETKTFIADQLHGTDEDKSECIILIRK